MLLSACKGILRRGPLYVDTGFSSPTYFYKLIDFFASLLLVVKDTLLPEAALSDVVATRLFEFRVIKMKYNSKCTSLLKFSHISSVQY